MRTHVTGRPIHGVPRGDHLLSGPQDILECPLGTLLDLVDPKDRPDVDSRVDVATPVERVESDTIVADEVSVCGVGADHDRVLPFLGDEDATLSTGSEGVDHDLVREDVELLLFFTLDVLPAGQTDQVDQSGFSDVARDVLAGDL